MAVLTLSLVACKKDAVAADTSKPADAAATPAKPAAATVSTPGAIPAGSRWCRS